MADLVILADGNFAEQLHWPLTVLYLLILALVCVYGLHRYWLTLLYFRTRRNVPRPDRRFDELPMVTVQLPMYNEKLVARRVIEAACRIDYPAHKLQIQVLDDSTDESAQIACSCTEQMKALGHDVQYVHREHQHGFKAGALREGLKTARGKLIAIFDADFVPPSNFLKRTVHYFTDPEIGMVQTRWDHLNRDDSLLTRCQAIFLDGHFVIEHTARNRSGRWMNFNGTAGLWRRQAIESTGNWQHDTLTEDLDLSYRAQLAKWKFVYLPRVTCPAELPPETNAFKNQQHRWTKGSIQTAKKILFPIIRSDAPLATKLEAFFHLTTPVVYLLIVMITLMSFPVLYMNLHIFEAGSVGGLLFGTSFFLMATASVSVFYIAAQRQCHRGALATLAQLPMLMAIGIGISLNNAIAVIEALAGHPSQFIRTPKYAAGRTGHTGVRKAEVARMPVRWTLPLLELLLGVYLTACVALAINSGTMVVSVPFLMLFATGYLYVGLTSIRGNLLRSSTSQ